MPITRPLMVRLAALPLTPALPSVVAPSLKVTMPVACPPYCGVIIAVNMTGESRPDGVILEHSVVVVLALLTLTCTPKELLGAKLLSPW